MIEFTHELDASGLRCPLPLLRLKKAIMDIESGQIIKVITTDPAAHLDFGVYTEQAGHQIVHTVNNEQGRTFYIQKK